MTHEPGDPVSQIRLHQPVVLRQGVHGAGAQDPMDAPHGPLHVNLPEPGEHQGNEEETHQLLERTRTRPRVFREEDRNPDGKDEEEERQAEGRPPEAQAPPAQTVHDPEEQGGPGEYVGRRDGDERRDDGGGGAPGNPPCRQETEYALPC